MAAAPTGLGCATAGWDVRIARFPSWITTLAEVSSANGALPTGSRARNREFVTQIGFYAGLPQGWRHSALEEVCARDRREEASDGGVRLSAGSIFRSRAQTRPMRLFFWATLTLPLASRAMPGLFNVDFAARLRNDGPVQSRRRAASDLVAVRGADFRRRESPDVRRLRPATR